MTNVYGDGTRKAERQTMRILREANESLTANQIAERGEFAVATIRNALTALVRTGLLIDTTPERAFNKEYTLAPEKPAEPEPVAPEPEPVPEVEIIVRLSMADYLAFRRVYRAITAEVRDDPAASAWLYTATKPA